MTKLRNSSLLEKQRKWIDALMFCAFVQRRSTLRKLEEKAIHGIDPRTILGIGYSVSDHTRVPGAGYLYPQDWGSFKKGLE